MNNTISIKIITQEDVAAIFDSHADRLFEIVEDAFLKASKGEVLFPDKISQIFDTQTQNRINCMPATLLGIKVGFRFSNQCSERHSECDGGYVVVRNRNRIPNRCNRWNTLHTTSDSGRRMCRSQIFGTQKGGNSWIYWSRRRGSDALYTAETSLPIDQNLQSCFPAQCNRRPIHSRI